MYNQILSLFVSVVGATQGTLMFSTLEVIATCCCAFVCIIPFLVVWKVIKLIVG